MNRDQGGFDRTRRINSARKPRAGVDTIASARDGGDDRGAAGGDETMGGERARRYPATTRETLAVVDRAWGRFRAAAASFPSERMDERLTEKGWTRKQMLAHIAAWHETTTDRLGKMIATGKPVDAPGDEDAFNARVARQAVGRTAGEILKEMEMTFNRLRRRIAQLEDEQLVAADGWAAHAVAANTYEHYEEHAADVYQPPGVEGQGRRR